MSTHRLDDRYELLDELPHVTGGRLFRALDVAFDEIVGVKQLGPNCGLEPQPRGQLLNTIRHLQCLPHPLLARVYSFDAFSGLHRAGMGAGHFAAGSAAAPAGIDIHRRSRCACWPRCRRPSIFWHAMPYRFRVPCSASCSSSLPGRCGGRQRSGDAAEIAGRRFVLSSIP